MSLDNDTRGLLRNALDGTTALKVDTGGVGISPDRIISKWLKSSTGAVDMIVNGSVTPVVFEFIAAHDARITRIDFELTDSQAIWDRFGGIALGLTNGIKFEVTDASNNTLLDMFDNHPVKLDIRFIAFNMMFSGPSYSNFNDRFALIFQDFGGVLALPAGYKIRLTVQDDLTSVYSFRGHVKGYYPV